MLLPKDYIRYRLTGDYATDLAGAAGTSLLNVAERRWSTDVLDALEIPQAWMPATHEGTHVTGEVTEAAADATGLRAGTPVVAGGGDQAAGAVGVGAVEPHIVSLVVGTSGVVFLPLPQYACEPEGRVHAFCHAVPGMWHFMGVMLSAAGSLQWYRDTLAADTDFDTLLEATDDIPAGSDGLFFLPYLTGERTPYPDPMARGAFIGLTSRHTQAHMTRAVLEGVAYGLKDSFRLMEEAASLPDDLEIRISGGGARSPIWRQIIADVLNQPLLTVNTTEGAAYGAALLAAVGAGLYDDVPAVCAATIQTGETITPSSDRAIYDTHYATYQELYPALQELFPKMQNNHTKHSNSEE
jgi:xylulokinase